MPSFCLMTPPPPSSTPFPYTPLFRPVAKRLERGLEVVGRTVVADDHFVRRLRLRSEEQTSELPARFCISYAVFLFNDTATTQLYPLSLHAPLPTCPETARARSRGRRSNRRRRRSLRAAASS